MKKTIQEHDWFLRAMEKLQKSVNANSAGWATPYLLHYFAGRSAREIAMLLDWDVSKVLERIKFVENKLEPDAQVLPASPR